MQPSYPGDEKMQAGIGEEKELSVIISYQSSVRVEENLSGGGAVGFVRNAKWSGGIVDGSESGTNPESNSPPPSMSIWECQRSSICPRRKIRAPVENESGQFS